MIRLEILATEALATGTPGQRRLYRRCCCHFVDIWRWTPRYDEWYGRDHELTAEIGSGMHVIFTALKDSSSAQVRIQPILSYQSSIPIEETTRTKYDP